MKWAYYNEFEPYCAEWLRTLIRAGHIAPGYVDERSVLDVTADDLAEFGQCHFFAGIGGWPLALRMAGVSDEEAIWTGSCPCQPFSAAGKGGGFADERHLWPAFHWLIGECRPDIVFGEQVEGSAGRAWLDLVFSDLEGSGYACGTAVFPAAGVGAPHGRHRTYWLADAQRGTSKRHGLSLGAAQGGVESKAYQRERLRANGWNGGVTGSLAEPDEEQRRWRSVREEHRPYREEAGWFESDREHEPDRATIGMADAADCGWRTGFDHLDEARHQLHDARRGAADRECRRSGSADGFWRDADWLLCRDGKWRPVEPGTFPLAHGLSARVGKLRAYGNAIVPQAAVEFIQAYLDVARTVETAMRPVRVSDLFG